MARMPDDTPIHDDPDWPRASAWLAGAPSPTAGAPLTVVGLPVRAGSVTPGRCDRAPSAIRAALTRLSTYDVESGVDLRELPVRDCGDAVLPDGPLAEILRPAEAAVRAALEGAAAAAVLGGNDAITRPAARACADRLSDVALLTFDGHFDLRDTKRGLSNGNPVRALLDDGLPGDHVVEIGTRPFANSRTYAEFARAAGIQYVTADQARARGLTAVVEDALERWSGRARAIYVDVDLDVLERAQAPGSPGSRPGGLDFAELRRAVVRCGIHPQVRALGIVELDPTQDVAEITTTSAALLLLSFASGVLQRMRATR
jgi:formiminoglutamase